MIMEEKTISMLMNDEHKWRLNLSDNLHLFFRGEFPNRIEISQTWHLNNNA